MLLTVWQDSCKVCHRSLVGFDPSIVSQIGLLEVRLLVSFLSWISRL